MKINNKAHRKDSRKRQRPVRWRAVAATLLLAAALACVLLAAISYHSKGRWPRRIIPYTPAGIILHHSATDQRLNGQLVDAQFIDRMHARRGFNGITGGRNYHIGYHYIIRGDGVIEAGRPEWMWGSHTRGHNDQLGICLIGDFSSGDNPSGKKGPLRPSKAQLEALNKLLCRLSAKYHFKAEDIHRHRDYAKTACPGDRFPFQQVVRRAF